MMTIPAVTCAMFLSAVGFYRTEKDSEGWTLRDPNGSGMMVLAIEKANMNGPYCEKINSRPYADNLRAKGDTRETWVARTAARLHEWGFNVLGTSCDDWLQRKGFGWTQMIAFGARVVSKGKEYSILPWKGAPCQAFPNVFHPKFRQICDDIAKESCLKCRDDRSLLGYYLDNELNWWGEGDWYRPCMLDCVLRTLPKEHGAYMMAMDVLSRFNISDPGTYLRLPESDRVPARSLYTRSMARKYFRTVVESIRKYDRNHLILGCRFAGVQGAPDEVWQEAGKYCDVVSFNCYPSADFANGRLTVSLHRRTVGKNDGRFEASDLDNVLDRLYKVVGKPMMITEWSFIGLDAGLPCKVGCGQRLSTQRDRANAVGMFLDFVVRKPYLIGSEYFMWTDDPEQGCTKAHPEDSNYGLVDVSDEPYKEVVDAFRARNVNRSEWIRSVRTREGWRFMSPSGESWIANGVEKIREEEKDTLPRKEWAERTARSLTNWKVNTIGSGSDWEVAKYGNFATTEMIALSMWMKDRGDSYRLTLKNDGFCDELANVFHPKFAEICDIAAKASCEAHREDRNLIGYFLDNELDWWGDGDWRAHGLMDYAIRKLPDDHTAHIAAERICSAYACDMELARRKYTEEVAERYFSTIVKAIRKYDPNHLILGVRFAGIYGAPDVVWRIAGKWCDVITLNCYPRVDLSSGDVWLPVQREGTQGVFDRRPLSEMLMERHRVCGRPLFISEWGFVGLDIEHARKVGVAQEFDSQDDRAKAVESFQRYVSKLPYVIGKCFYRWADEPMHGKGGFEVINWGLVDPCSAPYVNVIKAFSGGSTWKFSL